MAEPALLERVYRLRLEELARGSEHTRERRFFLDYDLLTSTVLIEGHAPGLLFEGGAAAELAPLAELGAPLRPWIPRARATLWTAVLDRAELALRGEPTRTRVSWDGPAPGSVGRGSFGYPEAVAQLATYQARLFAQLLPGGGPAGIDLETLERAFELFVDGALRTRSDESPSLLNMQPDSAYFFCFAEFALTALELGAPEGALWRELAPIFVRTQEVYRRRHEPRPARRRKHDAYRFDRLGPAPALSSADFAALRERYRQELAAGAALAELHAHNAAAAFADEFPARASLASRTWQRPAVSGPGPG